MLQFAKLGVLLPNLFLQFVSYVFFVFAIGLLAGTLRKDNVLESGDVAGKATRKLVLGMFWAISLFLSIVESTILFKMLALFLGFVNSIEVNGKTEYWSIGVMGPKPTLHYSITPHRLFPPLAQGLS